MFTDWDSFIILIKNTIFMSPKEIRKDEESEDETIESVVWIFVLMVMRRQSENQRR